MYLFKRKARERLDNWNLIRQKRLEEERKEQAIQDEKQAIRQRLMDRYNLPETVMGLFLSYRNDEDCYSYVDEGGKALDCKTGDIIPYRRRGDIIFFYEITRSWRKYGDYGYSDYGYFWDLKYHHSEKIPLKIADPKKALKISWKRIDEEMIHGFIQGIRIVRLKLEKDGGKTRVQARYVKDNFSKKGSLPSYYDHYFGITEAKMRVQTKVNKIINDGGEIRQFFIPHKIRRKNRK